LSDAISVLEDDDFDLAALVRAAWQHKTLVILITLVAGAISVVFALTLTPIYRADIVITEARDSSLNAAPLGNSVLGQLGGLASIAGINLSSVQSQSRLSQAVLKSRYLVDEFIERNNLIPVLFARSKEKKPTLWLAVQMFQNGIMRISDDARQGKTTVTIDWTDPEVAARWANEFVALANEVLRARALDESNRNVAYLTEQIDKTNVVELQRVMYNLIENETKTLMMANARQEYAFVVVDPATVPERRLSPNRRFIVMAGTVAGFVAAIAIVFALDWWRSRARARATVGARARS
jgi:uncharacterized protein involved in exopolysaccharide biosynthesis